MVEAAVTLPDSLLEAIGNEVANKLVRIIESRELHANEFVQLYHSTTGKRSLEDDYLGGISTNEFTSRWRNRIEAEPDLILPIGETGKNVLYHGNRVMAHIAEHSSEIVRR